MPKSPSGFRSEVLARPENIAVYAAAKNFTIGKARKGVPVTSEKQAGEEWQETGWDFYDTIGEYRYAVDWVGNLLSRATLHALKDGKTTTDALPTEVVSALFGGQDGQSEMLRALGIHYTVAGEASAIQRRAKSPRKVVFMGHLLTLVRCPGPIGGNASHEAPRPTVPDPSKLQDARRN